MSDEAITAVQYGVGPIGARLVRAARDRGFEFVGAVDIDPEKVGRDLAEVCELHDPTGVQITEDLDEALGEDPDIVLHSTVSSAVHAKDQIHPILEAGYDVISTCEELAFPWYEHELVGQQLDDVARSNAATCLATGVNPGFVMDAMPAYLATPMERIDSVEVSRVQNAGDRREPLQRKVGAGLSPERFDAEIATGAGHIGSTESTAMLAHALGWDIDTITESIDPVIADQYIETDSVTIHPGEVAGVHQVAKGYAGDQVRVTLELKMAVGLEANDTVIFEGRPDVSITVANGYHGDIATTAIVVNCVESVITAEPGMVTMLDLPVPGYTSV